ncbi:hypothetical protein GCM10009681_39900 [Luedemannella helvata]|uniref:Secreted protein n=1 Tax=Luedemannella helvata TaxID=349315 RepID=A0ABP4X0J1_9ACTN
MSARRLSAGRLAVALAAVALATGGPGVAGCTPGPRTGAPASSAGAAPDATGSPVPRGFDCGTAIESLAAPPDDYLVVDGDVAVPARLSPVDAADQGGDDPRARWFAKFGLIVRAGATAQLAVGPQWTDRAAVEWGSGDSPSATVRVPACPARDPARPWQVYAGGMWAAEPSCVPLVITAGTTEATVLVGLNRRCS